MPFLNVLYPLSLTCYRCFQCFPPDLILPSLLVGAPRGNKTSFLGAILHFLFCTSLPSSCPHNLSDPSFLSSSTRSPQSLSQTCPNYPSLPNTLPQAGLLCDSLRAGHPALPSVPQAHRIMGWGRVRNRNLCRPQESGRKVMKRKGNLEDPPGGSVVLGEALPSEDLCKLSLLGGRKPVYLGGRVLSVGPLPSGTRDSRALNSTTNEPSIRRPPHPLPEDAPGSPRVGRN